MFAIAKRVEPTLLKEGTISIQPRNQHSETERDKLGIAGSVYHLQSDRRQRGDRQAPCLILSDSLSFNSTLMNFLRNKYELAHHIAL